MSDARFPHFLWVGGLHGAGVNAVLSTLDGHPDILAFPFDLSRYLRIYNSGLYALEKQSWANGVRLSLPLILDLETVNAGRLERPLPFNVSEFESGVSSGAGLPQCPERFSLEVFLGCLGSALKAQYSAYQNRSPRYFCFLSTSCDFPWAARDLVERGFHLIPYRRWDSNYQTHRELYLSGQGWPLHRYVRSKAPRYRAMLERACRHLPAHLRKKNFFTVDFESLRSDPRAGFEAVCAWLSLPYHANLDGLSLMGIPEQGVRADGKVSQCRISPKGSRYRFVASAFEQEFYRRGYVGAIAEDVPKPDGTRSLLRLAWRSAWQVPAGELFASARYQVPDQTEEPVSRRELVAIANAQDWSTTQFRQALQTGVKKNPLARGLGRLRLFATFLWVGMTYPLLPRPKELHFLHQVALRLRLMRLILWVREKQEMRNERQFRKAG